MNDLNAVTIGGRLTRDPELRFTQGGTAVTDVGLAVNRKFKDNEEVSFLEVTMWGSQAETLVKYFKKGNYVFFQGRLKQERWESDGGNRSRVVVVGERFLFPPSNKSNDDSSESDVASDDEAQEFK